MEKLPVWLTEVRVSDVLYRLIGNPHYGTYGPGNFSHNPAQPAKTSEEYHKKRQFFDALRNSIEVSGVKNPICCHFWNKDLYVRTGMSRLWACQELKIEMIPALVADHDGTWSKGRKIRDEDDLKSVFHQEPAQILWQGDEFCYVRLPALPGEQNWEEIEAEREAEDQKAPLQFDWGTQALWKKN